MDCCCSGTEITQNGGYEDQVLFPVCAVLPCRDTLLQHPRTRSCDLLSKMSSSVPLDFGYVYLFLFIYILACSPQSCFLMFGLVLVRDSVASYVIRLSISTIDEMKSCVNL